jgi:hypothetical protein
MNNTLSVNKQCTSEESEMARLLFLGSCDNSVSVTTSYGLDNPWFDSGLVSGPTHPPFHWLTGIFSRC